MIQLETLKIENYLSIDSLEFEFKPGFHLIAGQNMTTDEHSSNGSGKSSLIEAPPWAFYKFTERDEVCRDGDKETMVSVTGLFDGQRYTVTRYRNHSVQGNNVTIQKEGGDVSTPNIRIANKEIEDMIGIPQQVFLSSIIIPQGTPFNFTQLGPTDRKMLLEEVTGFIWWDQVRPRFTEKLDEIRTSSREISETIQGLESSITNTLNSIDKLQQKVDVKQDDGRIDEVTQSILDLNTQINGLEQEISQILGGSTIDELVTRERFLDRQKTILLSDKRNQENLISDEKCPTCGLEYPEEYLMIAKDKVEELTKSISILDQKLIKVSGFVQFYNTKKQVLIGVQNKRNTARATLNEIKLSQTKIDDNKDTVVRDLMESIQETRAKIAKLTPDMGVFNRKINVLNNINNELLPSSEFRTRSLNRFIDVLNTTISEICLSVDDNFLVSLVPEKKGIGFNISKRDKPVNYKNLSGGEKRRIDIIILLAIQKYFIEMTGRSCNLVVFDEIFDNVDSAGIKIIVETIKNLFDESTCVLVITHNDLVKSSFDSIIYVTKHSDEISRFDFSEYK